MIYLLKNRLNVFRGKFTKSILHEEYLEFEGEILFPHVVDDLCQKGMSMIYLLLFSECQYCRAFT